MSDNDSPTGKALLRLPTWLHVALSLIVAAAGAAPDIAGAPEWLKAVGRAVAFIGAAFLVNTPGLRKPS